MTSERANERLILNSKIMRKFITPPITEYLKGTTWDWCLKPHTEKEIEDKIFEDYNDICFTYLCEFSPMSHAFAKRLAILSLGYNQTTDQTTKIVPYLTKDNIDEFYDEVEYIYDAILNNEDFKKPSDKLYKLFHLKQSKNQIIKKKSSEYKNFKSVFTDRLDWNSIIYTD